MYSTQPSGKCYLPKTRSDHCQVHTNYVASSPPTECGQHRELVDTCIASSLHAVRATVHSTLGVILGAMVFHRDMFHDIPIVPNLDTIQAKQQARIDYNLLKVNAKRVDHRYQVNDEVLQIQH